MSDSLTHIIKRCRSCKHFGGAKGRGFCLEHGLLMSSDDGCTEHVDRVAQVSPLAVQSFEAVVCAREAEAEARREATIARQIANSANKARVELAERVRMLEEQLANAHVEIERLREHGGGLLVASDSAAPNHKPLPAAFIGLELD